MELHDTNTLRSAYPKVITEDALVDTKTAARILGLHNHHTLEVWRSTKRHPSLRYHCVGRAIRYRVKDLQAFLTANAVGASPGSSSGSTGSAADRGALC